MSSSSMTRRQFFSRMRSLGFAKSRLQMTRIGLTYEKEDPEFGMVTVTVPKHHESTFHILGNVPYSGIFVQKIEGRETNWGIPVDTNSLGLSMFQVCLGLCSGDIQMESRQDG